MKTQSKLNRYIRVILFLLLLVFSCAAVSQKNALHLDEVWSYGLSNNPAGFNLDVEEGKTYESAKDIITAYMSASPENTFKYHMVYENQKNDTHPPLYYDLLHTICSFSREHIDTPMPERSMFCSWL